MAKWSQAAAKQRAEEIEQKKAARLAAMLAQRVEMFKRFRDADWQIHLLAVNAETRLPDNHPDAAVHFYVKMPGAHPARIRTWAQLERLVTGL